MPKYLRPVRPNVGIQTDYQTRLDDLIDEMHRSVNYWIKAKYRANPPEAMAQDASPAATLRAAMRRLSRRWLKKFDELAPEIARHFATRAADRSDKALAAALRKAGFTVKFKMTAAQNDAVQAVIGENVALIKSIPASYLTQVEGAVMRSVATGRDIGTLTDELQAHFHVTRRRAAFIARDQNAKMTGTIVRSRQKELGITEAKWLHSAGGKHPRKNHVAYSGKKYNVETGAYIDGEYIFPGQLINCRCVSISLLPGVGEG